MKLGRYAVRVVYPNGKKTYVIDELDRRKRYATRANARVDKELLEDMAASRARCQRDYAPPQYKIVRLA